MPPPPPPPSIQENAYPGPRTFTYLAATPPPLSPFDPRNSLLPDPQTSSFQGPATPLPRSSRRTAFVDEERPGFPSEVTPELQSEEDFAKMSARFNEAMAEIDWSSDPFLGSGVDLSDILPIDPLQPWSKTSSLTLCIQHKARILCQIQARHRNSRTK